MLRNLLSIVVIFFLCLGCSRESGDSVIKVKSSDEKMNAAMDHARETINVFVERIQNPQPNDSEFAVKVKIQDGDNVEYLWANDITYANGIFNGSIANEPQTVKNIQFGQKIIVKEGEISDWKYLDNGKMIGNFTLRVLLEYMPTEQVKALREKYQIEE